MMSMAHTNNMYITVIFKSSGTGIIAGVVVAIAISTSCSPGSLLHFLDGKTIHHLLVFVPVSEIRDRVDLILKTRLRYKPRM